MQSEKCQQTVPMQATRPTYFYVSRLVSWWSTDSQWIVYLFILFAKLTLTYMRLSINYMAVCNDNMTDNDRKAPVEHS